jgi:hypothetical protein
MRYTGKLANFIIQGRRATMDREQAEKDRVYRGEGAQTARFPSGSGHITEGETTNAAPPRPNEIGWAVKQMWNGQAVTRRAWYGKHHIRIQVPDHNSKMNQPYVYITTQRGELIPWLASQADLLARDWQLHEVD